MTVQIIEIELVEPDKKPIPGYSIGQQVIQKHTFRLGLGPCGREVTALNAFPEPYGLEIEQWCEDNPDEPDYFGYPWHQIKRWRVYHTDDPRPANRKQ